MNERISHQSDDDETPNEWDILTSEQTQEDGASTEDAAEKQTPASPAQIAFERAMEQIPEGVDPVEYAKSPESYVAITRELDDILDADTTPKEIVDILDEITTDFLDRDGVLPDDLDYLIFPKQDDDELTTELQANHPELLRRMQEHRIEHLPQEIGPKIDEILEQTQKFNRTSFEDFGTEMPMMPYNRLSSLLDTYSRAVEASDGKLDMTPLTDKLNADLVPELVPGQDNIYHAQENFNMLKIIARDCPAAFEGSREPAVEAAVFANGRKTDEYRDYVQDDAITFLYDLTHEGERILDDQGQYSEAFKDYAYYGTRQDFFADESDRNKSLLDATEEIVGPERMQALRFAAKYSESKYYNMGKVGFLADCVLYSKDPEATKHYIESLAGSEEWKSLNPYQRTIAVRELEIGSSQTTEQAIAYAIETQRDCGKLFACVKNDRSSYAMIQDIGAISDAFPTELTGTSSFKKYDYVDYFEQRMKDGQLMTDEEKATLAENMARINNIPGTPDISTNIATALQTGLMAHGRFTEPLTPKEMQNYDHNVEVLKGIDTDRELTYDMKTTLPAKLTELGILDRDYSAPSAQENLSHLKDSCIKINSSNIRRLLIDFVTSNEHFTEKTISPESINGISNIIRDIQNSNSLELRRIAEPLTRELIDSSEKVETDDSISYDTAAAERKLASVEEVFLRNNLPSLAKNLLVFNTLHPMENFRADFIDGSEYKVSPMLAKHSEHNVRHAYTLILDDLIHNSINSNSRELRSWLEELQTGQGIMDRISSGDTDFDSLSPQEQAQVRNFVNSLAAGHNQTIIGQKEVRQQEAMGGVKSEADIPEGADWLYHDMPINQDTIARINRAMNVTPRLNASDRLVRQFGYLGGLTSVERAIQILDQNRDKLDARNRETAKHPFVIHPGDLIKNVNGKYLDDMLGNGTNCQEFLGGNADSDGTPLDTDFTMCLGETDTDIANCDEIQKNPNGNYGYVWYVTHNTPDRFATTRKGEGHPGGEVETPNMLEHRLELFQTGVVSESHYGVRTGISAAEIDAIVIDTNQEFVDKTAFRIVKNGFYIPVYDMQGKLVFTPDDYDKLRAKLSGNHEYRTGEYNKASEADFAADAERTKDIDVDVTENAAEVQRKDDAIRAALAKKLEGTGLQFRDHIDDDLTPGFIEISNTGSTGRGTNVPGDGDFDYIFRVDQSIIADPGRFSTLSGQLLSAIVMDRNSEQRSGNRPEDIRTKHVHVDGMEDEVDIDITFVPRTDKVTYATEDSIKDYLSNFEGEERAQVVKNIIAAKKLFKAHECYKPRHAGGTDEAGKSLAQGGLGGVGVENWILQNGGSLTAAARSFLEAAGVLGQPDAEPKPLSEFIASYPIWDLGANHMAEEKGRYPHDNFTANNLDEEGYKKIVGALREYLGEN